MLDKGRPGIWSGVSGSPPPPLGLDATNLYAVLPWGEITGALPLYPASLHIRGKAGVINASVFNGHVPFIQQVG